MKNTIIGAIAGDVIGSVYEFHNDRRTDIELFCPKADFTDDTVLTMAVVDSLVNDKEFSETIWEYANRYPERGYGGRFKNWMNSVHTRPYNSYGNGSAMRVSPVGFAYDDLNAVLRIALDTAAVTHNHPEGIKGAQAIAECIFWAKHASTKRYIREMATTKYGYDMTKTIAEMRPTYRFNETCQGSVPQAIQAFLESHDYEDAIRLAISLGGDSDTIACMTGGIASAYYQEIPDNILTFVQARLPQEFVDLLEAFDKKFGYRR